MSTSAGPSESNEEKTTECPFCCGEVRATAMRCRHCGSWLPASRKKTASPSPIPDLDDNQILFVLDRGLVYFGKFVLGVVVLVLALATAYFGFDLNKAREDVEQMRKEVQAAQKEVLDTKTSVISISASAQQQFKEAQQKSVEASAALAGMLRLAQQESSQIHAIVVASAPSREPESAARTNEKSQTLTVPAIAALYGFPKSLDGTGQAIGLIELGGGYRDADIDAYFANLHLHRPHVSSVSVDQAKNEPVGDPNSADGAVMLDIEVVGAVAPSADIVAERGKITSEVVWNSGAGVATGGGVSDVFARPDWQSGAAVPPRKDGSFGRGIPDVAALADPASGFITRVDGQTVVLEGTNASAPLWAGLIVLMNQALGARLGYLNPRLYQQAGPAGVLRSITEGNNGQGSVAGYSAGPGWNAAAGWGTPDGQRLLDWFRNHPVKAKPPHQ